MPRNLKKYPIYPYSIGRHIQYHYVRPNGYPVDQIFLIRSGSGLFRDLESNTETILLPGMAFYIPANKGHEYYPSSHDPWHVAFIGFYEHLAHGTLEEIGLIPSSPYIPEHFEECWDEIGHIWYKISHQIGNRQDEHTMQKLSIMMYRLLLMLQRSDVPSVTTSRLEYEVARNEALQKAISLINQHFTEPLLISNLASAVGYSVQHFQRLFLQEYGVTPHKYLQNLRLERSIQIMMENAHTPIQDIAIQLGMEMNYFIRVFRTTYGITPGVMMKQLHESSKESN
ncbi:helix-turn-helix domain-containing protein [Paenibacillus sp. CMAA1364]